MGDPDTNWADYSMGHDYSTGCSCLDTDGSHTIFLRQMFVGESENCWISKMDVSILHVSTCDHSCKILALNFDTYIIIHS